MSEFENRVEEMEVTEQHPTEQTTEQNYEPSYDYDYSEQSDSSNATAFIAGAFAAGAAVGAVTTKLVGKVREKIAEKRSGTSPVKEKYKWVPQIPFRSPFKKVKVLELKVDETPKENPTNSNPENNQA